MFHKGKPLFFGAIACKIVLSTESHFRLGFSFGKKYVARAAARNRLRRVLSEPFSLYLASGKVLPAVDVVFFSVKNKVSVSPKPPVASIAQSVVEYINR